MPQKTSNRWRHHKGAGDAIQRTTVEQADKS